MFTLIADGERANASRIVGSTVNFSQAVAQHKPKMNFRTFNGFGFDFVDISGKPPEGL